MFQGTCGHTHNCEIMAEIILDTGSANGIRRLSLAEPMPRMNGRCMVLLFAKYIYIYIYRCILSFRSYFNSVCMMHWASLLGDIFSCHGTIAYDNTDDCLPLILTYWHQFQKDPVIVLETSYFEMEYFDTKSMKLDAVLLWSMRMALTNLPLMPHICVIESDQHWFR